MSFLSDEELAAIRADVLQLLPDACNLLSPTFVSDGQGGFTATWGTVAGTIACRLDALRGEELVTAGALQPFHTWVLTLPYGTSVTPAYRVEHGGNTYAVTSV